MIRIESIRLVPVVELEPGTYATEARESPGCTSAEAPEAWNQYWTDCLADSGLDDLAAISPGSWHVLASQLSGPNLAIVLSKELELSGIPGFPDSDGEVQEGLVEAVSSMAGGFALYDGDKVVMEPGCCECLGDPEDWRDALQEGSSEWRELLIGHAQVGFRFVGPDVEIRDKEDERQPHLVVPLRSLEASLRAAEKERKRFKNVVREALTTLAPLRGYSQDQLDQLARLLAGASHGEEQRKLSDEEEQALVALGYHRIWLDSGVLNTSRLKKQFEELNEPDGDHNKEHYRHRTLADYINDLDELSDEGVQHLLLIAQSDPDYSIKSDVPHSLIRANVLSDEQFEQVAQSFESENFNRLVSRMRLLRGLDREEVPPAYIQRCIDEGDRDVHEALLDLPELQREHVEQLAEHGANKRIRNMAGQLLNSRRFRGGEEYGMKLGHIIASHRVMKDGRPVGYLYREAPDSDGDSGWRVFSGDESQEHADTPENFAMYNAATVVETAPEIQAMLGEAYPTAFERGPDGTFRRIESG